MSMLYKEYGKTGKKVSAIGFGGMRFLPEEYEKDVSIAAELVKYAYSTGINYFDTAPGYCHDKSEHIFGEAFKQMKGEFYVSTKTMQKVDPTADDVRRRLEESLKRLGREKIDFYHMWCFLDMQQYRDVMKKGGPYEGALKAKEEGLVDHIVFSTHQKGEDIKTVVNEGNFDGVLLGYNAANFKFRQEGIKAAYKNNMGVVTMNPLGGGLIPQNPDKFKFLIRKDENVAQAALAFNISHDEITLALNGFSNTVEIDDSIQSLKYLYNVNDEIKNNYSKNLGDYMNNLCTGCGYCKGCPIDIDIPKFMDSYNLYLLTGREIETVNRLKWHWAQNKDKAAECIECGACEEKCTQHLNIIERLNKISSF